MTHPSKTCFIVNPSAKGDRARSFLLSRQVWHSIGEILETGAPGDGERLAAQAVQNGYTTIIAAGGDGTVLEVLNGMMRDSSYPERVRLGVLPLGTVNVFAKELRMPVSLESCREVFIRSKTKELDLPFVRFDHEHRGKSRRYFAQLGGAGLDALAIQAVDWELKKLFGPLAYVWAGLKVICRELPFIQCRTGEGRQVNGTMVLIGNGSFYGGRFRVFPNASLTDGLLHALVFHRLHWSRLPALGMALCLNRLHLRHDVTYLQSTRFDLSASRPIPFELEGDVVGCLPAQIEVSQTKLPVIVP